MRTPVSVSISVNGGDENWLPRSPLTISGGQNRAMASSKAARRNSTSIVFDNRQLYTRRVAQPITATRFRRPRRIGTWVMSARQTRFGRSIGALRRGHGQIRCSGCGIVVRGR